MATGIHHYTVKQYTRNLEHLELIKTRLLFRALSGYVDTWTSPMTGITFPRTTTAPCVRCTKCRKVLFMVIIRKGPKVLFLTMQQAKAQLHHCPVAEEVCQCTKTHAMVKRAKQ